MQICCILANNDELYYDLKLDIITDFDLRKVSFD